MKVIIILQSIFFFLSSVSGLYNIKLSQYLNAIMDLAHKKYNRSGFKLIIKRFWLREWGGGMSYTGIQFTGYV